LLMHPLLCESPGGNTSQMFRSVVMATYYRSPVLSIHHPCMRYLSHTVYPVPARADIAPDFKKLPPIRLHRPEMWIHARYMQHQVIRLVLTAALTSFPRGQTSPRTSRSCRPSASTAWRWISPRARDAWSWCRASSNASSTSPRSATKGFFFAGNAFFSGIFLWTGKMTWAVESIYPEFWWIPVDLARWEALSPTVECW
jgi:hypothetical protein